MNKQETIGWWQVGDEYAWGLIGVMVVAFVSLFFSLQAGMFLLFFLCMAWWVWHNPEEGFLFLIITGPLLLMLKITQTIGTVTLLKDVVILTLAAKLFLLPLIHKHLPYRRNVFFAPLLALLIWTGVEMVRADSLILGVLRARDIVLYILLYVAVLYLPNSRKFLKRVFMWFAASAIVVMGLGIYQWLGAVDSAVLRFDPVREVWIPRISSIMAHPSILGQYLVMVAVLMAAFLVYGNIKWRLGAGSILVVTLPFIYLTYSRAVWIGLVVAMAAMILFVAVGKKLQGHKLNWRTMFLALAVILLLVVLLRYSPVGVFVRTAVDPTYGSNEERLEFLVRLVAPMKNSEAMFGRGLGDVLEQNFRTVDLEAYDIAAGSSRAVQLTKNRTLVDNQYLKTFVEMGLVGLLIYLWIYWRFLRAAWKKSVIGLWGIGFLAAFVIQGLFIDIWDIFPTNAAFWIVAALISKEA